MKCIENYLANPFSISSIARNNITVQRPIPVINRFNNFEQRHYTFEEMDKITKNLLRK